ncbi:MAG: DUF421 domain-containing protein [Clostridia bacterium]|nr:DUF421 domain-containing protein [Clostridia bacterium]MBR5044404.1 DUF421 domain-containing protein [Clostridia bacterium]
MATILYRIVVIYILLSLSLRIMGKRQVGELEVSDLISTLLLSEIAALPVADPEIPLLYAVIPLIFILSLELLITCLKNRFSFLKRIFEPKTATLIRDGKIDQAALKKLRISVDELMGELRLQGVDALSDVSLGTVEQNGRLSVLLAPNSQPLTRAALDGERGGYEIPVVLDGVLDENALSSFGIGREKVDEILNRKGLSEKETFLLTLGRDGRYTLEKKEENR